MPVCLPFFIILPKSALVNFPVFFSQQSCEEHQAEGESVSPKSYSERFITECRYQTGFSRSQFNTVSLWPSLVMLFWSKCVQRTVIEGAFCALDPGLPSSNCTQIVTCQAQSMTHLWRPTRCSINVLHLLFDRLWYVAEGLNSPWRVSKMFRCFFVFSLKIYSADSCMTREELQLPYSRLQERKGAQCHPRQAIHSVQTGLLFRSPWESFLAQKYVMLMKPL